jgi:spoIIIJ-associated protein
MDRTTLEVIAPSVEDAVEQGLTQLGLPREAVDVEILDQVAWVPGDRRRRVRSPDGQAPDRK